MCKRVIPSLCICRLGRVQVALLEQVIEAFAIAHLACSQFVILNCQLRTGAEAGGGMDTCLYNQAAIGVLAATQQPPTEVGGLVTYGLKVRIRVD